MNIQRHPVIAAFSLVMVAMTPAVHAAWTSGEGEYLFGPETAETVACSLAVQNAQLDALRKILGENVTADQTLSCREERSGSVDEPQCQANRMIWSQIGGAMRSFKVVRTEIHDVKGARACRASVVADVMASTKAPSPDFDIGVRLARSVFRAGEELQIELTPTIPMYAAIFNWLPYESLERQVVRIFPNRHDRQSFLQAKLTIPTAGYRLKLELPDPLPPRRTLIDEYLLIVISKDPIEWRDFYSLSELRARIAEIASDRVRFVKRGYQLVLPQSSQSQRSENAEIN